MIKLKSKILLLLLIVVIFVNCSEPYQNEKKHLFGQENSIWTESIYLRGVKPSTGRKLKDEDLIKYANTLKKNHVKYAYLFAGPYQRDGHLPDYAFSNLAINSVKRLKELYPKIIILPWVGGVQNRTVYLGDSIWVKNALLDTKKLIKVLDVPGIHIDLEYILRGDSYLDETIGQERLLDKENYGKNVNSFHKKLRSLLPNSFISSVVVSTAPDTKPWKRKTTIDELSVLVKYVDQLSFLYYDTYINSQTIFEQNCVSQINDIKILKDLNTNTQFLMAIGTFINEVELRKYRNLDIENIPNSLKVIKRSALKISESEKMVDGIAIYCDWETDIREWKRFRNNWVR